MGLLPILRPWKSRKIKYVIFAPPYSDKWGGVMALYGLAEALNKIGAGALVWPFDLSPGRRDLFKKRMREIRKGSISSPPVGRTTGSQGEPARPTRRPTYLELKTSIVVYPEIVEGNPLGAKRVVRWFLNKPGRLTGKVDYGPGELYFYQQAIFDDPELGGNTGGELTIINVMDDVYRQVNFGKRSGTCYILRKGKDRAPNPLELDGPVIDDLTHREIARLFNECEYCVSYDLHTFFSYYAALCGCKSVVVPEPGVDRNEWQPAEEFTYGIAYGMDDLDRAERTRPMVKGLLGQIQDKNLASAESFHHRCEQFFFP